MSEKMDYGELRRVMLENENARLEYENDELRELIADMYKTIDGLKRNPAIDDWLPCTSKCPHWADGGCAELADDQCWYTEKINELGIEVEA